jgi:hypothetical protein
MTDNRGRANLRSDRGRATLWIGGISAIIAAVCYSSFLLSPWTDAASSTSSGFVSELEDPGQPFAWLYRTSDVVAGLGILVAAWVLWRLVACRRWAAIGVALFALTGASSMLDAATSMQCDPSTSAQCARNEHTTFGLISQLLALHTDSGLLGFVGSAAGAAVLGVAVAGRWPRWGRLQIALGIAMASCGLADIVLLLLSSSIGTTERTRVLLTSGWFLVVGLFLAARARSVPARSMAADLGLRNPQVGGSRIHGCEGSGNRGGAAG